MTNKLRNITELYAETIKEISDNTSEWTKFLTCASMNYKYSFSDQVLIYAQKPNAVACAEIETWNKSLNRWVNKGAKGIALIAEDNGYTHLRYVFDVSDTNNRYGKNVVLWSVTKPYERYVIEALENRLGELEDTSSLSQTIISASYNLVQDNLPDYLADLIKYKENSFIEELDELNIEVLLRKVLSNSVSYIMLQRCGLNPRNYFANEDFNEIVNFNTTAIITRLGIATSDISEMGLREIYSTIRNVRINEIDKIRTFDKNKQTDYDIVIEKRDERSELNGQSNLYKQRGLSDTRFNITSQENNQSEWKIRNNETQISKRESEEPIHRIDNERPVNGILTADTRGSRTESETIDRTIDETREDNRGIESNQPNEMGGYDEQYQEQSRGNSNQRTNLQLGIYNKTVGECPYVVTDAKVNQILSTTPHLKVPNREIINYFDIEKDVDKRANFLKSIFNNEYIGIFINDEMYGYKAFDNGVLFWKGNFLSKDTESLIDWKELTKHYEAMILLSQLNERVKPLPTVKEQLSLLDDNELKDSPELSFSQEFIDIVLQRGSNVQEGKYRIYHQFQKSLSTKENIDFLKKEYGIGGSSHTITGSGIGEEHDSKGITLYRGYFENRIETLFNWTYVEKRIKELIKCDRYLNLKEQEEYPNWLNKREQEILSDDENEIAEIQTEEKIISFEYDYKIGDKVYIGANTYKILSVNEDVVRLYDFEYPLFNQEMPFEEFDKKVKDNPSNEHLQLKTLGNEDADLTDYNNTEIVEDYKENDIVVIEQKELSLTEKEELIPEFIKKKKSKVTTFDIHPEIKNENRNNFHIIDDNLGVGSDRQKFMRNIEAIKTLKLCETENRFATKEEQSILSEYVGWGGLPQAFEPNNNSWANEYLQLKSLLDEDEYSAARESTLTAFFTPPVVIRTMYKALESMGMKTGNILEPSCGIGNFIGMLPDSLNECNLYGIEIDSVSGRIAQQLYQKSSIAVQGFEKSLLPDSFFDASIGNVPFGDFKILDKRYDKNKFLIHDYFFAKTLDKIRPGGIIVFITSKGTLDKANPSVRKYIAQRAELLGAIRLPDNTFKDNAGTKVTADIIFLQKRDSITDLEPDWVYLDTDGTGIKMNSYFVNNPEMICGNMVMESTQFGMDSTCKASEEQTLEEQLNNIIQNIHAEIKEYALDDIGEDDEDLSIPADFNVRNFSYTLVDNKIYYRENSKMYPKELPITTASRVKGLIEIRECVRTLIELQTEDYPDEEIKLEQSKLNRLYDSFTKKYGLINNRANASAFSDDSSFYLLCSLEILDENKELLKKADMFTKRTIKPHKEITKVDTANEALIVSISEKARVDLPFMRDLLDIDMDIMIKELEGEIFNVPEYGEPNHWVTADEYLSGNVRGKLQVAEKFAETDDRFQINVKYLKEIQPEPLTASEISVRLGATWIPSEDIDNFIFYLLTPSYNVRNNVKTHYMKSTGQWNIENKNCDRTNIKAHSTYGTHRINAYKIIEETLNLKDVRIYDYKTDENGNRVAELNKKETAIAQAKQEQIKTAFDEWIWSEPERRERLCEIYNETFNSNRPREFDGSHIKFNGMNPEISLRPHQLNAIARILYGGNTLLAHEVGAGKTFEMVAAAMESKRLGLCNKSLFVVPNHIVEQFASEFLQLYPSANILVTTRKDFETANRKKICSRIATGDFDAVIISHSQFEKIPMSAERQRIIIQKQIDDITLGVQDLKQNHGENFTIKQLVKTQKILEAKLAKLNDQSRKDSVVTFEELGVDRIFVDEAHYYKNLFLYTKMRNVGGIAQTEAQKSSDLFMKCRYLDELTGGKGIIFATGTPISNSMVELYTMQRYLQYAELEKRYLQHFDSWASTFGETVTAIELAPEGTGYRAKTRFAKFYNLPELMALFKEVADIQTADMLNLPVPKANYEVVVVNPSELQKQMVEELSERAEAVRNKQVDSSIDNMLKITNDGRKLALDQRLLNELLPDYEQSKVSICANNIYKVWDENKDKKLTQLVFCDLSTPHGEGKFNVYDDLKRKLLKMGVPENEVDFIHSANTDIRKKEMFAKVRKGIQRVLIGSTQKMGAGTNCQDKLVALHDLDCPWRPSDLIQRSGRIIRQGNENAEVFIYRYVTEGTFDAYLYQLVENKQRFISQIMTSKTPVRSAEDIDETALSYAEIKALAAGNPLIIEKTDLDTQVAKLKLLKQTHLSQIYAMEDRVAKYYPSEIKRLEHKISAIESDISHIEQNSPLGEEKFSEIILKDIAYKDKVQAGAKLIELCKTMDSKEATEIGMYRGLKMELEFDTFSKNFNLNLKNELSYTVNLGSDVHGNIVRINNVIDNIPSLLEKSKGELEDTKVQLENAKEEIKRPFKQDDELKQKSKRLDELNILLNMNQKDKEIMDFDDKKESPMYEREYAR